MSTRSYAAAGCRSRDDERSRDLERGAHGKIVRCEWSMETWREIWYKRVRGRGAVTVVKVIAFFCSPFIQTRHAVRRPRTAHH